MLNPRLIPTPLMPPKGRPPLRLRGPAPGSRFRIASLLVHGLWLLLRLLGLKLVGRLNEDRLGALLRQLCQRMGVLWIKVGQLLSMRADLAPPGVRAQLAHLLDRVHGFPGQAAIARVEAELGGPLSHHFSDFDPTPVAAASIAQVHRARLRREGVWVAVKVRRPEVVSVATRDLALFRWLVRCLEWLRFKPEAHWRDMLWELQEVMLEELDFRYEASNMRRLRRNLGRHGIHVPQVFRRYCTPAVLVMEYIDGVLMSDYVAMVHSDPEGLAAWRRINHVRPVKVAQRLLHSGFRQTFEENLFHGDLHPGNILLLRNSRLAFLDFGTLGSLERDLTTKVDQYMQALGARQYSKVVDLYFLFAPGLPPVNLAECKNEMIRRLQAWDLRTRIPDLPFEEKSFNAIQDELAFFASGYGVAPTWSFFRLTRAMATMDASLRVLIPRVNFHRLVEAYYRQRAVRSARRVRRFLRTGGASVRDWWELQDRVLDDLRFRTGIIRRAAQVFEQTTSRVALFFSRLFGRIANILLLAAAAFVLTALLQHWPEGPLRHVPEWLASVLGHLPSLDIQVWVLVVFAALYGWRRFVDLSQKFREQDPQAGAG